jgi:aquaporin Z
MPSLLRRALAEALGTFALVFIGAGSVIVKGSPGAGYGILGVALAHAVVLSVMVSATMSISGGHLNPAVTLGLLVARRTPLRNALAYIPAQLIAAVLAAVLLKQIIPTGELRGTQLGTPSLAFNVTLNEGFAMEAILTFFLVSAVFGTCVNAEAPNVGGFGIGLVLLFDILVGGPFTGAAMNPARAFGPAVASGHWVGHAVYWVGPILGGLAAALLWEYVLLPPRDRGAKT